MVTVLLAGLCTAAAGPAAGAAEAPCQAAPTSVNLYGPVAGAWRQLRVSPQTRFHAPVDAAGDWEPAAG